NTHGTNPKKADTDDDGLSDGAEVNTHGTNPKKADTDDDGLSDGDEVNVYGTDPLDRDTDNDTLLDGAEVNVYGTNPTEPDLLILVKPEDGATWKIGEKYSIRWNSIGGVGEFVRIELWRDSSFVRKIKNSTANDGKSNWKVPDDVEPGDGYHIYIQSIATPAIDDIGDNSFSVKRKRAR
ncbi:MAG: hypothetical protein HUU46_03755, partial [Candidatus Hydrogenedentes bacterium]|nr:hypothetical protein [Candidatus Hydrogenedentota bacterium]